ncbi:MAG TPA: hypothetical protein VNN73_10745 [Blastocatellia bacterium]|nr:hypothetical protein [Blastocatellia bacterium]
MVRKVLVLSLVIIAIHFRASAQSNKVESIGAFADASASESVRKALEPKGHRVVLADGNALCDIWLRASVPAGKTDAPGAVYNNIGESTLIGVITFPKQATDFRGQQIKQGSYTLRYALHPADGNHLGISPIRDFLLLIPVSVDQNADAQYKFDELVKMSAKTTGTNHPAVISLVAPEGKANAAAVTQNEHGHLVFSASVKSAGGADMPIAFVIKGQAEQ